MDMPKAFESLSKSNGERYWLGAEIMRLVGYPNKKTFEKCIDRAAKAITSIFNSAQAQKDIFYDRKINDYQLTRYGCLMILMSASSKKPEVQQLKAYLVYVANITESELKNTGSTEHIERVIERDKLKEEHVALSSTAKQAGVKKFDYFYNAGFRGMYNQFTWQLARKRGVSKANIYEYMGSAELAANSFRLHMTKERIESRKLKGQEALEEAHKVVGEGVRHQFKENTGRYPEDMPQEIIPIPDIQKDVKKSKRQLLKQDKPGKKEDEK